jgi:curved DNA-binding protein CbpA
MSGQSLYEVLGVEPTASTEAVKNAYRSLAKRYHPDTHPDRPEYEEILKEITAAYAVLGNPIKRAAYELRTASGGDTPPPEPADEWEPSAEELRNIYALDVEERDKEIERLCTLHPHLRQFFEDRPPPPRFKPSEAYIAEFRLRDRVWRLEEIERQCARHPHLREWFADLEAQCERAEEERAREIALQRERAARYENERTLFAGSAFAALGGAVGLFVGFVPVWIVAGVLGAFSGGWSSDAERVQAAFQIEVGWFWVLWIACGLAGGGFLFAGQLQGRWLESPARDITWTRVKGLVIAAPSIVVIITLISMRADYLSQTSERFAARVHQKQIEVVLPLSVKGVTIDGRRAYEGNVNGPTALVVSPFPQFALEYERAHPNEGLKVILFKRWGPGGSGGQNLGACQSSQVPPRGSWTCRWDRRLDPGHYLFQLTLNTDLRSLGEYPFTVEVPH